MRAFTLRPACASVVMAGAVFMISSCSRDLPTEPDKAAGPVAGAVTAAAAPSNDDFADARVVGALPFTDDVNTTEATPEPGDPDCNGAGPTVWYRFTPSADIRVTANTFGSDYDTNLSVYTGTAGDLTQIACNDDSGSLQSSVTFDAEAGETYYIMVGAFSSGPGGNLTFTMEEAPPAIEVSFTIARQGSVNPKTGTAVVRGTVTCSREATVEIGGELRQRKGRVFLTGEFFTSLTCDGRDSWEAQVVAQNGLLTGGKAEVRAGALFFDQSTGEFTFEEQSATVRLRGAGKARVAGQAE